MSCSNLNKCPNGRQSDQIVTASSGRRDAAREAHMDDNDRPGSQTLVDLALCSINGANCTCLLPPSPAMPKGLPTTSSDLRPVAERKLSRGSVWRLAFAAVLAIVFVQLTFTRPLIESRRGVQVPLHAAEILDKCRLLNVKPGPPEDFNLRHASDRFVPGTKSTLIKVRCTVMHVSFLS